jgi:hypothetical protein
MYNVQTDRVDMEKTKRNFSANGLKSIRNN